MAKQKAGELKPADRYKIPPQDMPAQDPAKEGPTSTKWRPDIPKLRHDWRQCGACSAKTPLASKAVQSK